MAQTIPLNRTSLWMGAIANGFQENTKAVYPKGRAVFFGSGANLPQSNIFPLRGRRKVLSTFCQKAPVTGKAQ